MRIVHLGLGAFARSHQAWYTALASDAHEWGIAGYTGRSPDAARALAAQDGLYTLVERGRQDDSFELVPSVVAAYDGADLAAFVGHLAAETTAVVTLTVSEAGYRLDASAMPDVRDPELTSDVWALERLMGADSTRFTGALGSVHITTAPVRLLLGLEARRRADAGPLSVVSCDNLAGTGATLRRAMLVLADRVDEALADWLRSSVSFVDTSVDRITPALLEVDRKEVELATGWADAAPVVAEPFSDWVLSGDFPGGRPAWETSGARIVDDVAPFAQRKLWLLNGAHTILAMGGMRRGHRTVAEAIADHELRDAVELFWDDAETALDSARDLDLDRYRAQLLDRFANARIAHLLDQIAQSTTLKLRQRIVPVAHALLERGLPAEGVAGAIAVWATGRSGSVSERVRNLDLRLAHDDRFMESVRDRERSLAATIHVTTQGEP